MIGLEGKTLKSKDLTLRLLQPQDKDALCSLLRDEAVTKPADFEPLRTKADDDWFWGEVTHDGAGIAVLLGDAIIGYVQVGEHEADDPEYADLECVRITFVIGAQYQRRGYGTQAVNAVTDYLLTQFDSCFAVPLDDNKAAARTLLKCGYMFNCVIGYEEEGSDEEIYYAEYVR